MQVMLNTRIRRPAPGGALGRLLSTAGLLGALLLAAPARGQEATVYGTGALDGYETGLALLGVSISPSGYGLQPVANLQAYFLRFDAGVEEADVWSVGPAVGLAYRAPVGAVEARVGYNFQSGEEEDVPVFVGEGGGDGVTTTLLAQYWGGTPQLEGIVNYGWGSDYLWSQAQATVPVVRLDPGAVRLGALVIWEGEFDEEEDVVFENGVRVPVTVGEDVRALSVGPVLEWSNGRNLTVTTSGGWKDASFGDSTWFARVTFARYGIGL